MRVKSGMIAVISVIMILSVAGETFSQDTASSAEWNQLLERIGERGNINWTGGYIEAVGIGAPGQRDIGKPQARPNALRAAQIDAYRNMLEVINGVRIDSTTTIRNFTVENDVINTQVQGMVKGAKVMKQEYLSDGTVEVTVRMPLAGDLASVVIPKVLEKGRMQTPPVPPTRPEPPAAAPSGTGGEVFTGLVVDARGIQARPAMSPRIIDENGQEIYGSQNVDREYAVQQGMSGYARDLTAAQSNSRVTNNPLSVKAVKTEGAGRSDIVIGSADAAKVRSSGENLNFLRKCRIMIVLD